MARRMDARQQSNTVKKVSFLLRAKTFHASFVGEFLIFFDLLHGGWPVIIGESLISFFKLVKLQHFATNLTRW